MFNKFVGSQALVVKSSQLEEQKKDHKIIYLHLFTCRLIFSVYPYKANNVLNKYILKITHKLWIY